MLQANLVHDFKCLHRNIFIKLFAPSTIHLQIDHPTTYDTFAPHVFNLPSLITCCVFLYRLGCSPLFHTYDLFDHLILKYKDLIFKERDAVEDVFCSEISHLILLAGWCGAGGGTI